MSGGGRVTGTGRDGAVEAATGAAFLEELGVKARYACCSFKLMRVMSSKAEDDR